jgi:hypothetical protein
MKVQSGIPELSLVSGKGIPFPYKTRFIEGIISTFNRHAKDNVPDQNGDVNVSILIAIIWVLAETSSLQPLRLKLGTPPQAQVQE